MPPLNPGGRYSPGLAYDEHRRRIVLYGGAAIRERAELQFVFDTWEWDGRRWTEVK